MQNEDYDLAEERMLAKDKNNDLIPLVKEGDIFFWVEGRKDGSKTEVLNTEFHADMPGDRIIKEQRKDTLFTDLYPTPALAMYHFTLILTKYNETIKSRSK